LSGNTLAKVTNKIFAPHSPLQREIMEFLAGEGPPYIMWVACGTKFGKTAAACGGMAYAAPKRKGTTWRIVAPIYKQVKISWKYISEIWPKEPYVKKNKADMLMHLPGKKVDLQFWHGQSPEDLEGEGIHGQINDECAKLKQQVFDSSRTTFTRTRGRMLNISTPRGRNWFYRGCKRAQKEEALALEEKRQPREIFRTAPTSANPYIPQESIEEARALLPDRLFRQYYLSEFVESGAVFPNPVIDLPWWKEEFLRDGPVEYWVHPEAKDKVVVAGCDWAKKRDFTVLTVWDHSKTPYRMVGFLRFQGKPYTEQVVDVAKFLYHNFKECEMLYHDKTGVGEALDDMLAQVPGLIYKGIVFTNASKSYMVNDLITAMERREIVFPWWKNLVEEFEIFEVDTNELGNMRYQAAEGGHDDIVFSTCLGIAAAVEYSAKDFEVKFLEELPNAEMQKDTLENYMFEELDIDEEEGF